MTAPRAVGMTLAGALAVLVLALVVTLSDSDVHLAGTNNVFAQFPVATLERGDELCERHEIVPADAAVVRLSLEPGQAAPYGWLRVGVLENGRVVSSGRRLGGWGGDSVEVPIEAVPDTIQDAQVCVLNRSDAALTLRGYGIEPDRLGFTLRGEQVDQQVRLTYLRADSESWWSMAAVVAHRMGLGRGELFGGWLAFAWLAGVLAMGTVAAWLVLRPARA